jgi:hypothetical protein
MTKKPIKKVLSQESLADLLYPSQPEDYSESVINLPPEKRRLHTETMDYTVSSLMEKFRKGDIYIPHFQRPFGWSKAQASRLIESLIIQCPIPVIYFSQETDERLAVVDGNQRINAIDKFLRDEFVLTGLTAYPELTGAKYSELDPRFQRHIQSRILRCLTILKETHPQVKFDVFERLNTGSLKLSPQELRHGIYYGDMIKLCKDITEKLTQKDLAFLGNTNRLRAEELVLRYFAFFSSGDQYEKPLSNFLNVFAESRKKMKQQELESLKNQFLKAYKRAIDLFGDSVFRTAGKSLKTPFNAAVFDVQMHIASRASKALEPIDALSKFKALMKNRSFLESVSKATSDEGSVKKRFQLASEAFGVK